nr:MAG TPA: hypothetical protein [Caudoviricetes sp.]
MEIRYNAICDCCILHLVIWFIGTYFLRYIHELISFIHFMMNSCYSFMCTCTLIIGYRWR